MAWAAGVMAVRHLVIVLCRRLIMIMILVTLVVRMVCSMRLSRGLLVILRSIPVPADPTWALRLVVRMIVIGRAI